MVFKEIPIVGDDEDGAGIAEEVMREVGDTGDVQHVARF